MKKLLTLILVSILFSSCGSSLTDRYVCSCQEKEKLQEFIAQSIKPSNNMYDEEMEDVISELRITGIKVICQQKPIWITWDGNVDWSRQKQDSCLFIMETW